MGKNEIIERLRRIARHSVHIIGEEPFIMSLDDGVAVCEAIDIIQQPERKKGQWIPKFNGMFKGGAYWFKCSECERIVPEVRNGGWNYCPNCGADMTEGEG